jgi:hypothetical protein
MKIQNPALAGVTFALRFHPGQTVTGDRFGIFDMPDADAKFLIETSGWRAFDADRQVLVEAAAAQHDAAIEASRLQAVKLQDDRVQQIAELEAAAAAVATVKADEKAALAAYEAAKAAELVPPPPVLPALPELPAMPAMPPGVAPAAKGDGPDLAALDRAGLIQVADDYGVVIDRRWGDQRIRETLDSALYGASTSAEG